MTTVQSAANFHLPVANPLWLFVDCSHAPDLAETCCGLRRRHSDASKMQTLTWVVFTCTFIRKCFKGNSYQIRGSFPHSWLPTTNFFSMFLGGGFFFSISHRAWREQCVLKTRISACKGKQNPPCLVTCRSQSAQESRTFMVLCRGGQNSWGTVTGPLFRRRREGILKQNARSAM